MGGHVNVSRVRRRIWLFIFIIAIVSVLIFYVWLKKSTYKIQSTEEASNADQLGSIGLFTLNIWFGDYKMEERMAAIGRSIEVHQPHIITFQEVTHVSLTLLMAQPWFKLYNLISSASKTQRSLGYFVIILTKFHVMKWKNIPFKTSRMERSLLLAVLKVSIPFPGVKKTDQKALQFTIATSHLESMPYSTKEREKQLANSLEILSGYSNACLMGDLNLEPIVDGEIKLPHTWSDIWLSFSGNSQENGYTWDPTTNTNAQVSEPNTNKDRFDRVLCKLTSFTQKNMTIVTTDHQGVYFSDHFALYTELQYGVKSDSPWTKRKYLKKVEFERPPNWKKIAMG